MTFTYAQARDAGPGERTTASSIGSGKDPLTRGCTRPDISHGSGCGGERQQPYADAARGLAHILERQVQESRQPVAAKDEPSATHPGKRSQ